MLGLHLKFSIIIHYITSCLCVYGIFPSCIPFIGVITDERVLLHAPVTITHVAGEKIRGDTTATSTDDVGYFCRVGPGAFARLVERLDVSMSCDEEVDSIALTDPLQIVKHRLVVNPTFWRIPC